MTGDRSRLRNFVKKFIRTVRFGNELWLLYGFGDYVIGDSVISRIYYVKGLGHNMFSVRQFCDSNFEVAFRKHSCYVRDTDGVELIKEVVATACYTQNRSLIHTRHNKTPYELVHDKKLGLTFFYVFGALCYYKGYVRILENCNQQLILEFSLVMLPAGRPMAPVQLSTGPAPTFLIPGHISSGLVPNPVPAAPYVPLTNKELEILFQPMFDENLEPPRVERPVSPALAVPVPVNSAGIPSSTTIDQDAPSPSHLPSSSALQSPSSHQGVAAGSTIIEYNPFSPVDNNPFVFYSET
ncbi:hypothetical protein Tco_0885120 [Tanacetum coccineum]